MEQPSRRFASQRHSRDSNFYGVNISVALNILRLSAIMPNRVLPIHAHAESKLDATLAQIDL